MHRHGLIVLLLSVLAFISPRAVPRFRAPPVVPTIPLEFDPKHVRVEAYDPRSIYFYRLGMAASDVDEAEATLDYWMQADPHGASVFLRWVARVEEAERAAQLPEDVFVISSNDFFMGCSVLSLPDSFIPRHNLRWLLGGSGSTGLPPRPR